MANLAWSCHCQTWSSMTLARFGKNLQGLSKMDMTCHDIVKYYHVMSWHCEWHVTEMSWPKILSWCLSWWQNALSRFVTYCHRDKKKMRDKIKKPCQHTDRKIEKKGAFGPCSADFFCHGQKGPFSVTVCHGDKPWQLYDKPWQTVTNHDKPWQTHDKTMTTMTNLDNTMTNLDNPWQYHDKPRQSSWETLICHDNTMSCPGNTLIILDIIWKEMCKIKFLSAHWQDIMSQLSLCKPKLETHTIKGNFLSCL